MPTAPCLAAFLAGYEIGTPPRPVTDTERALIGEAIESYICDGQWLDQAWDTTPLTEELDALTSRVNAALTRADRNLIGRAIHALNELSARLTRREHANLIIREHLCMLSDPRTMQRLSLAAQNRPTAIKGEKDGPEHD